MMCLKRIVRWREKLRRSEIENHESVLHRLHATGGRPCASQGHSCLNGLWLDRCSDCMGDCHVERTTRPARCGDRMMRVIQVASAASNVSGIAFLFAWLAWAADSALLVPATAVSVGSALIAVPLWWWIFTRRDGEV